MKPARFPFLSNVVLFLHTEMIAQGNWVPAWGHVSAASIIIQPQWGHNGHAHGLMRAWPFETRFVPVAMAPTIGAVCSRSSRQDLTYMCVSLFFL